MVPKIIHQTARSQAELTWEERLLIKRLRRTLPDWSYRFWDDQANDALVAEYFPQYLSTYRRINRGVVKADIARCMYMAVFGGIYCDTDYKFLRKPPENIVETPAFLPVSRGLITATNDQLFRLGNAIFGSEANHPFWRAFISDIFAHDLALLPEEHVEQVTGPEALTAFWRDNAHLSGDIMLVAKEVFHPRWATASFRSLKGPDTIGIHMCWGSWRTQSLLSAIHAIARRKLLLW